MTKRIFTTLWVLCLACKLGFGQDMVLSGTVKDGKAEHGILERFAAAY